MTTRIDVDEHALPNSRNHAPFYGREAELAAIGEALRSSRIVTIVGFGGLGKTRLSQEFAARAIGAFADGIFFIEAESTTSPQTLARSVLSELRVGLGHQSPLDQLTRAGESLETLLILDGCEPVLEATTDVVRAFTSAASRGRVLCTSRLPLGIIGEHVLRLDALSDAAAAALFTARSSLEGAHLDARAGPSAQIERICRKLEGIALAIELAASWTRVLSLDELEARLDERFQLLTHGKRDGLPRHQSLRALVDWSYASLDPELQRLFAGLSIFASTFTLDAVIDIFSDESGSRWTLVEALAALVDRSLVIVEIVDGRTQYRMLDTLREYAAERLQERGEEAALVRRLNAWCVAAIRQGDSAQIMPHVRDFRRALTSSLSDPARVAEALTLLSASIAWVSIGELEVVVSQLETFLQQPNTLDDMERAKGWLNAAMSHAHLRHSIDREMRALQNAESLLGGVSEPLTRLSLLQGLVRCKSRAGVVDDTPALIDEMLELARTIGNPLHEADGRLTLGYYYLASRRFNEARETVLQALRTYEVEESNLPVPGLHAQYWLAEIDFAAGNVAAAVARMRHIMEVDWASALSDFLYVLATYLLSDGQKEEAGVLSRRALERCRRRGLTSLMPYAMMTQAAVYAHDQPDCAAQLLGYANANIQAPLGSTERVAHELADSQLQALLAPTTLQQLVNAGAGLIEAEAFALATGDRATSFPLPSRATIAGEDARPSRLSVLTAREWSIAERVARGMTNGAIADELFLSRRTVETHVATILRKCNLRGRVSLASLIASIEAHAP